MVLQQKRPLQLLLPGMILLGLLIYLCVAAYKHLAKPDPSDKVIRHRVNTSPDEALKHWSADNMRSAKGAPLPKTKAVKRNKKHPQSPPQTSGPQHS